MAPRKSGESTPTPVQTQQPIEIEDESDTGPRSVGHKHWTRGAKHGRSADTYEKYDLKVRHSISVE